MSTARARYGTNVISDTTVRAIDEPDCPQSHKSSENNKHIKRVQIRSLLTGLDGKVQRIHLESDEEDKPGIRAYGLPKKNLNDNGIIERVHLGEDRIDDVLKNSRLVNIIFDRSMQHM